MMVGCFLMWRDFLLAGRCFSVFPSFGDLSRLVVGNEFERALICRLSCVKWFFIVKITCVCLLC